MNINKKSCAQGSHSHTCSLKLHPASCCYTGFDTLYWYTSES